MKKLIALVVLLVVVSSWILLTISRSRTFQFFGELYPRINTSQKVVALTFDDGPTPQATDKILAILEHQHVRATFFLTGGELKANPTEGKKIVDAGHEIGNHTYSHVRMMFVTPLFVRREIESTDKLIREAGYKGEITFRPPYGKKLFALPYYLSKTGRKSITWDVEPDSYPEIAADSDRITHFVMDNTKPGSIIILHVMYASRATSMNSVDTIIEGLRAQGYSFKTVSDLIAMKE